MRYKHSIFTAFPQPLQLISLLCKITKPHKLGIRNDLQGEWESCWGYKSETSGGGVSYEQLPLCLQSSQNAQ